MNKNTRTLFMLFLILYSCSKDPGPDNYGSKSYQLLDKELAKKIAMNAPLQNFIDKISTPSNSANKLSCRVIDDGIVLKDRNEVPALYVFNYEHGFIVLSAEKQFEPICAIIENGKFEQTEVPSSYLAWYDQMIRTIEAIRYENYVYSDDVKMSWAKLLKESQLVAFLANADPNFYNEIQGFLRYDEGCCEGCPNYPYCLDDPGLGCGSPLNCDEKDPCGKAVTDIVGPLLSTTWGQKCTYNERCPDVNCTICWNNKNAPTGCVATAIAQVIRYFEKNCPQNYQYAIMPDQYGNSEVQRLMFDAGKAVGMRYGCSGSTAFGSETVDALLKTFKFSSAQWSTFGSADIKNVRIDLDLRRPVILEGCSSRTNRFLGILYSYSECHEWVCDGYWNERNRCYNIKDYLHMNWGWDGFYNGWFLVTKWNPANTNFQYVKHYTYNIKP